MDGFVISEKWFCCGRAGTIDDRTEVTPDASVRDSATRARSPLQAKWRPNDPAAARVRILAEGFYFNAHGPEERLTDLGEAASRRTLPDGRGSVSI